MKKIDYRFNILPYTLINLFDSTLLSKFIALLRISNAFADEDGYFKRSQRLLQNDIGCTKSSFLTAMDVFESLGILTVKKDSAKTLFRIKVNTERFSDFDKIPTDVLIANIRSITLDNGKTFKLEKLLNQNDSSIDNQQNKVETTEMEVNKIVDDDVKRNCNLAYQLLIQSQANRQSN